jgi:hypothetical protein
MPISDVVGEIDKEVARLLAAKKLLTGGVVKTGRSGRGHTMSAATRRKIAQTQRARWAKEKGKK